MKQIFLAAALLFYAATASLAQQAQPAQPRTVNASGQAEREIEPDEIYLQVDLTEYDKKGGGKVSIETIKNNFLRQMQSLGLTEKEISVNAVNGYNQQWDWSRRRRTNPDLKATISYWVKVNNAARVDAVVEKLDDQATANFFIAKYSHSRMKEIKDELRMAALKNAREKAVMYAAALGETVGKVLTLNEPNEVGNYPRPVMYMAKGAMAEQTAAADPAMQVDFRKMKIVYECSVTFLLN